MVMNILHRKEQLVLTAIDIIDDIGIQNLTTREIAKRQKISEATLFRHFKNKNELLIAVLDYLIQFDTDILQTTKLKHQKPIDALIYMIISYAEYYENYPAITTILQIFDVLLYEEDLAVKVKEIQASRTSMIRQMIEEAMESGELKKDLDSNMITAIIFGFFREICFEWRVGGCAFPLKEKTRSTLMLLLQALGERGTIGGNDNR